jgi:hypothetical protein
MRHLSAMAIVAILAFSPNVSTAQPAPADQHKGHHPGQTQTVPATPGTMGGGMMGGGMMGGGMMGGGMMGGGMMGHGMMGGMHGKHIEGRLAFLKAEIKITPAQETQWTKFADVVRTTAKNAQASGAMGGKPATASERMASYEKHLVTRLETVRAVKAAFDPLYNSLSDEQKKIADELLAGPMSVP